MITNALIDMLNAFLGWIASILPDWTFVADTPVDPISFPNPGTAGYSYGPGSYIRQFLMWLGGFNAIFPVSEALSILSVMITVYGVLMAIRSAKWLIGVVRGSGTA